MDAVIAGPGRQHIRAIAGEQRVVRRAGGHQEALDAAEDEPAVGCLQVGADGTGGTAERIGEGGQGDAIFRRQGRTQHIVATARVPGVAAGKAHQGVGALAGGQVIGEEEAARHDPVIAGTGDQGEMLGADEAAQAAEIMHGRKLVEVDGDRHHRRSGVIHIEIDAGAEIRGVDAGATDHGVVAAAAEQRVVAIAAFEAIMAGQPVDPVMAVEAAQHVVERAAEHQVVARIRFAEAGAAGELQFLDVGIRRDADVHQRDDAVDPAAGAVEVLIDQIAGMVHAIGVVAGAADHGIGAGAAIEAVPAGAAVQDVIAATPRQRVVAARAAEAVGVRIAGQLVARPVAIGAGDVLDAEQPVALRLAAAAAPGFEVDDHADGSSAVDREIPACAAIE